MKPTKVTRDVYQQITDLIIAALEEGATSFQLPWHRLGPAAGRPTNIKSGKPYRGVNVLALWVASLNQDFSTGIWGTYKQWHDAGAQVRRGEKASLVVFYKEFEREEKDEDTGEVGRRKSLFARASWVFNADQVDGWEPQVPPVTNPVTRDGRAEAFISATSADIRHGGQRAFYRPATDHIQMPERRLFTGTPTSSATEAYYGTLLHELTHWTGAKTRCARDLTGRFGSQAYAMEELVAELGSAFLSADLGITPVPRPDHAGYIASWLKVLKEDKRAIFTAASKAAQAADHLRQFQPGTDEAA